MADMRRVATKVLPWILLAVAYIFLAVRLVMDIDTSPDRNFFFLDSLSTAYMFVSIIIGFAGLIGIYTDEFKSMVMIGVIGRGITREKFVLTKFLDLLALMFQMQLLTALYVLILKTAFNITFNSVEFRYFILMFIFDFFEAVSFVTIAAVFYFLSENAAIGMFAFLAFKIIVPVSLALIEMFSRFGKYHPNQYYISGISTSAFSSIIIGDVGDGLVHLFYLITVYIIGALMLTIFIFKKKELEF